MDLEHLIGQKLLLAFHGRETLSPEIVQSFMKYHPGGITLFRSLNMGTLEQIRALTDSLQRLAHELNLPSLLIATDQEGGQLMAVGDGTPLPGNMALGATRSTELAYKAGEVLGRELSALGINVDYAPCADVNVNPRNPVVGVRSFGEDPKLVGELTAALIQGIQFQGVAATAKHFPGHGDTASDSHHGLGIVPHSRERLQTVELPPFLAAFGADVKLVMTAHLGISSIDGDNPPPATLSKNILDGLLRRELGFKGVVTTDAMDMRAIRQGELLREDCLRAAKAGADLLLMTGDAQDHDRAFEALLHGAQSGQLAMDELQVSVERISRLKEWIASKKMSPDLGVICSPEHMRVADEIAEKSITLVRDRNQYLPLELEANQRIAVITPTAKDLTPADTSSHVKSKLGDSLRACHPNVDEFNIPFSPARQEVISVLERACGYDVIIVGTINAYVEENQARFVRDLLQTGKPIIVIAMRLPYDLAAFPQVSTYLCTYSILEPSMKAVARAIFGFAQMTGQLPVSILGIK
ncbi:beta-N-acetylhexosaminidase [Anaerolineales bacterium]|nr:beta-N-acetylhexosaminidase [Anaerolineales bacterium]